MKAPGTLTVTGTAGLAAVLAGVVMLANPAAARSAAPDPGAGPNESIAVDIGDAQDAVEGTDYRVVDRNHRKETDEDDKAIGYSGFTPDGTGVGWIPYGSHLLQIDPTTLARDLLPAPPERADIDPLHVGDDKLVFRTGEWDALLIFDRDTRQWNRLDWSGLPAGSSPGRFAVGSDNRLYTGVSRNDAPDGILELWSIALDDPTDVRDEHELIGSVARSGGSLVWTDPTIKKTPYLHFRDLATGTERTVDTGTDRTCAMALAPSGNDDVVLTRSACDDGNRVTAYSVDGTSKVTVTGDYVAPGGVNDTHILVYGDSATYTADLDTGRLLKVSDERAYGDAFLSGSYVFWHEPTPDSSVIQVVAEMS